MGTEAKRLPPAGAGRVVRASEKSGGPGPSPPPMRVVGIGASAGGLGALKKLFASMPEQPDVCFVVVVHLSAEHESHLASLLQSQCRIPVQQVTQTTPLEVNHVYVIPPGANIDVTATHLRLSDLESKRQERAPIDHFFRTLAEAHQAQAVGVVLTGTGSDGTAGLRRIRERGGLTVVQSPEEAEYDAMPRSAIGAGVADLILPLEQILAHILQIGQALPEIGVSEDGRLLAEQAENTLRQILAHVRSHTGHDFALYKRSTLLRRIRRRMQLHRVQDLDGYMRLLREEDQEVGLLFEDLLITVTEFFRDPEVFAQLESEVIPELFKDKGAAGRVRAWSVGCATGEEAYSLAMLLMEEEARREVKPKQVQVFATDLHEPSLRRAREGIYPDSIEADVSPARLRRFFDKRNSSYRIHKAVRERLVFATHNILQDPPFSHLQLICCRNVLIYLHRDAQRHLASLFHYALEEGGFLLVGTAEGVESDLFVSENKKLGLYRRRSVPTPRSKPSTFPLTSRRQPPEDPPEPRRAEPPASYGVLHEQMVERYAPPSVLINPDGDLVHYSARAGRYLRLSGGTPTHNFYQLLPERLRLELRAAIHMARGQDRGYRSRPIGLSLEGRQCQVMLRVQPIDQPQMDGFFLVIFDELEDPQDAAPDGQSSPADANVHELEAELEQTKKRMQGLIEEHEAAQERTQAYNEELESSNEELRSTMEELETSKEEMQSMNEELTTLNQEIRQKVEELDQLSSDLHNLLTATDIATVFLDRDMRIRRFTPSMAKLLDMRDSDRGRTLTGLTHRLGYEQLQEDFQRVLDHLAPVEREVRGEQDRWYMARLQPYRKANDRIDGVVITFIDITDRKKVQEQIREAKELAEKIIDTVRSPMLVLDENLCVRSANESFHDYFSVEPADIKGKLVYELSDQWDIPRLRELLEDILPENNTMENFELEHQFDQRGCRSLILNARRIDHVQLILLAIEDVTERKQARQTLEQSRDELEQQVARRTSELRQQAERLQLLVRELASAEQRERKRMASVLHDDLQQLLVGVKFRLGRVHRPHLDESAARALEEAVCTIDQAIDTTRTLVRQVAPQTLYEDGLIPALRWLGEEMTSRHGLHVQIHDEGTEGFIDAQIKTLLFESIREMLFNVVKHAEVDEATVAVRQENDCLSITVSDEGVGFDAEAKASQGAKSDFGIFSWGNRIEALGGRWSIDAAPGRGTRVGVNIPLGANAGR